MELPKFCYAYRSKNPVGQRIVIIERGKHGSVPEYCFQDSEAATDKELTTLVNKLNKNLGVTETQQIIMLRGSLFGWNISALDNNESL